uniref:Uncharacterized protein n=1 Tax=Anopheles maculatus TaxID=74869 RepID=A0A182SHF2_9DIPT
MFLHVLMDLGTQHATILFRILVTILVLQQCLLRTQLQLTQRTLDVHFVVPVDLFRVPQQCTPSAEVDLRFAHHHPLIITYFAHDPRPPLSPEEQSDPFPCSASSSDVGAVGSKPSVDTLNADDDARRSQFDI